MPDLSTKHRQLRQSIDQHFDWAELRSLCFDLHIDSEHLSGDNKLTQINELILYVERNSQLPLLIELLAQERPNINWQNLAEESYSSILGKKARSQPFATALTKYLESLQAAILEGHRQDQYISLSIGTLDSEDTKTVNALKQAIHSSLNIETADIGKGGEICSVDEAVNQNRLTGLLGDPGIGKTTSLRYLVLKYLDAFKANASKHLPVWVSLSKWDSKSVPATEFIYSEFVEEFGHSEMSLSEFIEWLNNGELILFLDGLNELPQRERSNIVREKRDQQEKPENKIDPRENDLLVLARESQSRFILSCRTREYIHYPHWREFLILPLSDEQISIFISKHLGEANGRLEGFLEKQPQLRNLLRTPFFLRGLILLVQENWQDIPKDRFQLVQFTCQAALYRELSRSPESYEQVINSFGRGSLNLMERGIIGSSFMVSRELLYSNEQTGEPNEIPPGKAIRIIEDSGLLVRVSEDDEQIRFRYLHQLVQEAIVLLYLQQKEGLREDSNQLEVNALTKAGEIHGYWGLIREAQENLERAIELCPIVGAEIKRARILVNQSRLARQVRQTHHGLPKAQTAVELAETANDKELQAEAYHELGMIHWRLRNKKQAEEYFFKALEARKAIGDKSRIAYEMLYGLGDFYSDPSVYKIKKALSIQMEALQLFETEENQFGVARAKQELAHTYRLWGEVKVSEKYFRACIDDYGKMNNQIHKISALMFLGFLYRDMRRFDDAIAPLQQVYEESKQMPSRSEEISILIFGLGWINIYKGNYSRALELIDEAYTLAKQQASLASLLNVYGWGYGFVYWQTKNFKEAAKYFELYEATLDDEARLHDGTPMKAGIIWMRILGRSVSTSRLALTLSYFCWWLFQSWKLFSNPSSWFGKHLWRLLWWSNTIRFR